MYKDNLKHVNGAYKLEVSCNTTMYKLCTT